MQVVVNGVLQESEHNTKAPSQNEGTPPIPTVSNIDLDVLSRLMNSNGKSLGKFWVQAIDDGTASAESNGSVRPLPADPPRFTNQGPHFSYALQWIAFGLIALFGWMALLWKSRDQPTDPGRGSG